MRARSVLPVFLVAALGVLCAPSAASAQAPDPARAEAAHARAVELTRAGRHAEAAEAYEEAYRYAGRRELQWVIVGRSRDGTSREMLESLGRVLDDAGESPLAPQALPEAPVAPSAATLAASPPVSAPEVIASAAAAEGPAVASVEVSAAPTAVSEGALGAPPIVAETMPPQSEVGILSWSLAGLGGAALLGAAITGVLALETADELALVCPGGECPPNEGARLERAQVLAGMTDGLLIGGAAALTAGVIIGLLWPTDAPEEAPSASLMCLPGACMGTVRGAF